MTTLPNSIQLWNQGLVYVNSCQVGVTGNATLNIMPGQLRDSTNTWDIDVNSTLTVNTSVTGANGLDTGTIAANTWYAVFVIYDNTRTNLPAALISLSPTAPTMPSVNNVTYSAFRLVGWVRTNGSSNLITAIMNGNGNQRTNYWLTPVQVLTSGAATTQTTVNCLSGVAPIDQTPVLFNVQFTPAAAGNNVLVSTYNFSGTGDGVTGQVAAVAIQQQVQVVATLNVGNPSVNYINSAAGGSTNIFVRSFTYFI